MKEIGKIKDSCYVIAGQSPSGKSYNTDGIGTEFHQGKKAFGKEIIEHSNVWTTEITKLAEPGDILMSVRAPVGPTNITDRTLCIGRGLAAIRCKEGISSRYILYALKNIENFIVGNDGAVFNSINKKQIEDLPLPIIPLSEQTRIVSLLDDAFGKLERSREKALKLLDDAKEIFQAQLKKEMTPKEGWEVKKLGEICESALGKTLDRNKDKGDYVPYLCAKNVLQSYFDLSEIKQFRLEEKQKEKYLVKKGDLLVCEGGYVGRCAIWDKDKEIYYQNALHRIRPHKCLSNEYLERYLNYLTSIGYMNKISVGATIKHLIQKILLNIEIPLPPLSEQSSIVSRLDVLSSQLKQIEEKTNKYLADLDELKQSLLKKAFEGKL